MGYSVQNFKDGNLLHDFHLQNMEQAILANENGIKNLNSKINNMNTSGGDNSSSTNSFMLPSPIDVSIYSGGAIACIGDSITAGVGANNNPYPIQLGKALNMTATNLGASGTVMCTGGHRTCRIGALTEANCKDKNIVTILIGVNDWDQAKNNPTDGCYYTLGDINSEDTTCIYGAMKMWCNKIMELKQKESCANTKFFFMTPLITSWNNSAGSKNWNQDKTNVHGFKLRDLCQAIIDVCALYKIPVIDLNLYSGIFYNSSTDNNTSTYGGDGIHINEAGHALVTEAIIRALGQNPVYKSDKEAFYYILDYMSKQLKTELSYPTSVGEDAKIEIALTGINLSPSTAEVNAGESISLAATLVPNNTTQTNIVWSTSNPAIATVSDGVVLGVAEGDVVITCKSTDKPSISGTASIKVNPPASTDLTAINIGGLTEVRAGNTISLTATLVPSTTPQTNVEWYSDNTNIATVTGNGLNATVKGISVGQAYITCKSTDNTSISGKYFITVNEALADGAVDLTTLPSAKTSDITYAGSTGTFTSSSTANIVSTGLANQLFVVQEPLTPGMEVEVAMNRASKKFFVLGLNDGNTLESIANTACYNGKIMATPVNLYFDSSNSPTIMSFKSSDASLVKPACRGEGATISQEQTAVDTVVFKRANDGTITIWHDGKEILPPTPVSSGTSTHDIPTQWAALNNVDNVYLCGHGVQKAVSYKINYFGKLR